jgi:hypothetical protein
MSKLYIAKSHNLSAAWTEVFNHLMQPRISDLSPAIISISDFDERSLPHEIPGVREAIDGVNKQTCRTIASTIFPNSLWAPGSIDSARTLYERYERIWRTISKCPANSKGVYFRRMTSYKSAGVPADTEPVNQLSHVIDTFGGGNHRHSALQAAIFDPTRDHTNSRQRGFPCLQQVAFNASGCDLEVTGFYALQHHLPKAYGNYLGLCWLGRFMAQQMGLYLTQVTCIASSLKLPTNDGYTKSGLAPLKHSLNQILELNRQKAA